MQTGQGWFFSLFYISFHNSLSPLLLSHGNSWSKELETSPGLRSTSTLKNPIRGDWNRWWSNNQCWLKIKRYLVKKNRARKCVLDGHVLQRCLALCWNNDQLSWSARLSYPDIEECNTIISSILGVEVFHAYFVHPNVVGLAKLLLKLSLRLLSKYFSIQT